MVCSDRWHNAPSARGGASALAFASTAAVLSRPPGGRLFSLDRAAARHTGVKVLAAPQASDGALITRCRGGRQCLAGSPACHFCFCFPDAQSVMELSLPSISPSGQLPLSQINPLWLRVNVTSQISSNENGLLRLFQLKGEITLWS